MTDSRPSIDPSSPDWLDGYHTAQVEAGMGWFDDHVKRLEEQIEQMEQKISGLVGEPYCAACGGPCRDER